jgi:hypothetical protein
MLVEYGERIWEAKKIKGAWVLRHPIPKWLTSKETVEIWKKALRK